MVPDDEKMKRVELDDVARITITMPAKYAVMLDELRDDLSRSAYIRQLLKKERQYR